MKEKLLLTLALWLALVVSTWAQSNNALHFDGFNNYVSCPAINPTQFTVEAWVYPTVLGKDQAIISTLYVGGNTGGNTGMELHIGVDDKPIITINDYGNFIDVKGSTSVVANAWTHLAATHDGSTVKLYVNGVEVNSIKRSNYQNGTAQVNLGKRYNESAAYYYTGRMDEVRIWSTARTQSEITNARNNPLTGTESNLLAYYNFNNGSANGSNTGITTLTDATANAFNGTLTNFALTGSTSNWVEGYTSSDVTYSLTASPNQVSIEYASGSTATLSIASNTTWSIADVTDWLDLDVTSGTGNATITLTTNQANKTDAPRSVELVITGTGVDNQTVTVTQQRGTVSVSANEVTLDASVGHTATFNITSNTDWAIIESSDWFSVNPIYGNTNEIITVTADLQNNSNEPRSAIVVISGANAVNDTITITQEAATIALSRTAIDIDAPANSQSFIEITTDVDWKASCSVSWLSLNKTSGTGNGVMTITAEPLPAGVTERYANIVFAGTFQPTGVIVTQKALPNNALSFNGSNNYVFCKPVAASQFTAEAWIYPTNASGNNAIISNYYIDQNFNLDVQGNHLYLLLGQFTGSSYLISEYTFENNKWYHVAATYDGTVAKLYINGVQDANTLSSSFVANNNGSLFIGGRYKSYFSGKIDEVRLWSRARSADEIKSDLAKQTTDNTDLLVWYNFNQGIANGYNFYVTTLYDASGNMNDGELRTFMLNRPTSNWVEGAPDNFVLANTTSTSLSADAGSTTVSVQSNTNWTVTSDATWLTPDVTTGNGDATVTFAYTANNSSYTGRTTTLTFAAEGADTTFITFTQQAGKALSANFSADNTKPKSIPATVTFTDASTAVNTTITNWKWDFGDGSTSTDQNPVHAYTDYGNYTVSLIVSDGTFADTLVNTGFIDVPNYILMHSGNVTISDSIFFYDSGGEYSSYSNEENYTLVFYPSTPGAKIKLDFISFTSESTRDNLLIYNGINTSAPQLSKQTGSIFRTPLQGTNASGAICANFQSNVSVSRNGWKALVTQMLPKADFTASKAQALVNSEVVFTDTSILAGLNAWSWDFGDGTTSTDQNPTHAYTTAGTYTITLSASNGSVTKTTTKTIAVVEGVTARFTTDKTLGYQPLVQFTNKSFGAISYAWDFGDGSEVSTDENPTHTFNTVGTYTVTLTATDASGNTSQYSMEITATTIVPAFSADVTSGYQPTVQFTDATVGAVWWSWDFGDGSEVSIDENPTHTFNTAGTYTVTLTATDAGGNTGQYSMEITATTITPAFSADITSAYQPTVQFTDATVGATLWSWDFGDGSELSTEQNPQHTYTTTGVYTVSLTVSDGYNTETLQKQDYITAERYAVQFSANITSGYRPTVTFTDNTNGEGVTSWAWDFGDGNTSTEQNPEHTYTTPGVYSVSLTLSDGTINSTAVKQDYIYADRILMSNQSITLPDGVAIPFYDSGNKVGKYSDNQSFSLVLYPSGPGKKVQIDFSSFATVNYRDKLDIYDGTSASASLITTLSGTLFTKPKVTANNASGALFLVFSSDITAVHNGWEALISQVDFSLDPNLYWYNPASVTYGNAIGSKPMSATAGVPGTFTYSFTADSVFDAGTHTLTVNFTPDNSIYSSASKSVTYTVNKAELLVTADNATMEVGSVIPKLTITYDGFVNGENVSNLKLAPVAVASATSASGIGDYTIKCLSGFDTNYNFNYQNGILTIEPYTWTGATSIFWSTASNWLSNKVPSAIISVKIKSDAPNQPLIVGPTTCANLTIETGAVVTIASGATLSVTGQLVNNNGVNGLLLISDINGTGKLVNNTPSVPATIQQYIVQDQWHYFGLPIEGSHNANDFFHNFYVVKNNEDRPISNPWEYLTAQDNLTRGQGYGAFYSRNTNNDTTLVFKGLLNTGTITVETSNSGEGMGWNFVSNPYPCTLDWDVVKNNLNEIEDAVYVWNPTLTNNNKYGRYGTYVDGVEVNAQTQYIAPMQGFFVKAKAGNGGVSFTNAAKSTQASTFKSAELNSLIRLNASDTNGYDDETVVRFKTGSTHEFDSRYDARKLNALSSLNPQIYSVLNGDEYSINSIPEATVNTVIPFELLVKTTGTQQIAATELMGLDATFDVVLEDLQTGARTLLANSAYRFSATAGETRKFNLLFADATNVTRVEARTIKAYGAESRLCISNMSDGHNTVVVYNLNGKLVHQTNAEGSYTEVELPNGLYVVKVTPENGNVFNGKVRIGSFK